MEKEFEIAAIVKRPLAQEQNFLNYEVWTNAQSVIMTNVQMEENFGIRDYQFIHASPADGAEAGRVQNQLLQVIRDVSKAVLQLLHLTSNVPNLVLVGIMVLNVGVCIQTQTYETNSAFFCCRWIL